MTKEKNSIGSNILRGQRGITLVEVIVVMLISVMLILVSALGIGVFFRKYKELNAWAELQSEALECLNQIKNGVPVGTGTSMEYFGVTNAVKLTLTNTTTNTAQGLRVTPPTAQGLETPDYAHFYLYDGAIRCAYVRHGIQNASPLYLFPKKDNLDRMKIEKFLITKVNNDQDVLVVQVELNAKVETREGEYRHIKFKTKMAKK